MKKCSNTCCKRFYNVKNWLVERCGDFLDLFYPRLCIGCGEILNKHEQDLCLACLMQLPVISESKLIENFIEERFYGRVKIEEAISYLYYEKETMSQHILHEIKYHGGKELGYRLGKMFGEHVRRSWFQHVDALVPVPLHSNRLKQRGYNQSEWIARGMADELKVPVWTDILERSVENPTQTKKNAIERWENVRGIFQLKCKRDIEGKHLVIVDDVMTTGSTIEACVLPLSTVKDIKISVATLAVVD